VGRIIQLAKQNLANLEDLISHFVGERLDEISFSKDRIINADKLIDKKAYYLSNETISENPFLLFGEHLRFVAKLHLEFGTEKEEAYQIGARESHYGLSILCTWHLLKNAKSIAAYVGEYDSDGRMEKNLNLIKRQIVKRTVLIPEKLNLFIEFENKIWLGIFPHFVGYSVSSGRGSGRAWSSRSYTVLDNAIRTVSLIG
jgi:hypothetical protein